MKKEPLTVNPSEQLQLLKLKAQSIHANLMAIGFDFQNKVSGSVKDNEIFRLRDDILSRLRSIFYLSELMIAERVRCINLINKASYQVDVRQEIQHLIFNEKTLFDSTLYHVATIFDYVGNLSGYIFENKHNMKWNSLFRGCKDKTKISIDNDFKLRIIAVHDDFADDLFGHRSYLIHDKTDNAPFRLTQSVSAMNDDWSVVIFCPKDFANSFGHLKDLCSSNEVTIEYGFFWVLNEALTQINSTLFKFKNSIELKRKIPKGQEIFKLVDSEQEISTKYWNEPDSNTL